MSIGHNNPPEPTPFEAVAAEIGDLADEALLWLDGQDVANQDVADGLANLLNLVRAARKKADAARVEEKRPHDEAAKAVQERYKPVLAQADRVESVLKDAIGHWLKRQEAEKRAAAEAARQAALESERLAHEALKASAGNLAEREAAEALVLDAKDAAKAAVRMEKDKPGAGSFGRAVTLRTVRRAVMTDPTEAMRTYWASRRQDLIAVVQSYADAEVRAGAERIAGFEIEVERVAV